LRAAIVRFEKRSAKLYIIIAIIMFGVLVAVHEAGHFFAAKSLGVQVNEFAIGMGPLIWSRNRGETQYSLRALPIGGFCAMEGEDEDTGNPRAFTVQRLWKKLIILVAGSFMNLLAGLIIILLLFAQAQAFYSPVITDFMEGFPLEGEAGLQVGDRILKIDDERVYVYSDVPLLFGRSNGETMDLLILRNGEKIRLNDFPLRLREYRYNGETALKYGIIFSVRPANFAVRVQESVLTAVDFIRFTRMGIVDLISGAAGLSDMAGPVGIVSTISSVGSESATTRDALWNVAYFAALIAVNLAVMNLLPIPALDGGRIFLLLVGGLFTLVTKRKIDPKYEGYIHFAGFICLLALMAVVTFNDIWKIIGGVSP